MARQTEQQRIAEQQKMIEQTKQKRIAEKQRLIEKRTINQGMFNDKTLQEQQRQKNQYKFDENYFFNKDNFLKNKSNQKMSIHKIKKYDKRATQLDFGKFISNDNHIFKKPNIIKKTIKDFQLHTKNTKIRFLNQLLA